MPESNISAVEIAPVREMLRMYCSAIAERDVELRDLQPLIDKDVGWSRADLATSDGVAIYLPATIERFETRDENHRLLKVMLTHQAAHLEFGSFGFQFDRPSTRFADLRPRLRTHPDEHGHPHDVSGATELTRFFRLFPNRRLAWDIFAVVESARIEARVIQNYPGIARDYRLMRERALALRYETTLLPAREALLELLICVGLGRSAGLKAPAAQAQAAREGVRLMRCACYAGATVEDAAEAALRIYAILASVSNEFLEEQQFAVVHLEDDGASRLGRSEDTNRRKDDSGGGEIITFAPAAAREQAYLSPRGVDYRGEFKPELAQLLTPPPPNAREERKALSAEELAELLKHQRTPKAKRSRDESEERDPQIERMVQNLMRELERRDPRMQSVQRQPGVQSDDDAGPLAANQAGTFVYDEWDASLGAYRGRWCKLYEKAMPAGDMSFYRETLLLYAEATRQIRREFELTAPELQRKEKRLPDGPDHDLDAAVEALTELRVGVAPSEKIFWRNRKIERDVAVAFLLDLSGSTGEAIGRSPQDARVGERAPRRIIDVEKEAIVLMSDALETIGDRYGVFGFSGHGRDHVEFFVIKEIDEAFSAQVAGRIGRAGPMHATRMGPAIRHAAAKLRPQQARSKFLFLISDGRPQDRGYSQESVDKAYAVQDTRMALIEARREGIQSFCLTVDKEGNDYLRAMMDDFGYEVLADVNDLPLRLPRLYRKLTL